MNIDVLHKMLFFYIFIGYFYGTHLSRVRYFMISPILALIFAFLHDYNFGKFSLPLLLSGIFFACSFSFWTILPLVIFSVAITSVYCQFYIFNWHTSEQDRSNGCAWKTINKVTEK
jgi:hypothetical protein